MTAHLEDALVQLRTAPPPGLSPEQGVRRARLLSLLERYIDERAFPRRTGAASPVFVDEENRHCAMGALLAWTGGRTIVEHIRATRNFATVPVLADEPGLAEWLTENGLAPEEAALVQPTYYQCQSPLSLCGFLSRAQIDLVNTAIPAKADGAPFVWADTHRDAGVCAGEPWVNEFQYQEQSFTDTHEHYREFLTQVPVGAMFSRDALLIRARGGRVPAWWAGCANPLVVTAAMEHAPTRQDCVREAIARDPRWLMAWCFHTSQWSNGIVCGPDGRVRSAVLPARGTMAAQVEMGLGAPLLDDAGVTTAFLTELEEELWRESGPADAGPLSRDVSRFLIWDGGLDKACILDREAARAAERDAGAIDAGFVKPRRDAGVVDAGRPSMRDGGPGQEPVVSDGGAPRTAPPRRPDTWVTPAVHQPVEPGCSSSGGALLLGGLVMWRSKRRTARPA